MTIRIVVASFVATALSVCAFAAAPVYRVKQLPPRVGDRFIEAPRGINDLGQVVGGAGVDDAFHRYQHRAYIWDPQTDTFTFLPPIAEGDFAMGYAFDINNKGEIVGITGDYETNVFRAVIWKNGVPKLLAPLPGETTSEATAINDKGQIVGHFTANGNGRVAVIWQGGSVMELGLPKGPFHASLPQGINNKGYVVGDLYFNEIDVFESHQPWLWDPSVGQHQFLPELPSDNLAITDSANAINRLGRIAGTSAGRAVTWHPTTRAVTPLRPKKTDGQPAHVSSINNDNQMVGLIGSYAYVWIASTPYRLEDRMDPASPYFGCLDLSGTLLINNHGVIASDGFNFCERGFRSYILTPITN